ncbi:MAG: metallopeptidase family protein [Planctomycetota bacterium]
MMGLSQDDRDHFDGLVAEVIDGLPPRIARLLDEVPVVVLDLPTPEILLSLGMDPGSREEAESLCGLHTGVANIDRSLEGASGELPSQIHLFRVGIIRLAGGLSGEGAGDEGDQRVLDEVAVTLLHEIGHQFGLDEDDLERLGYA